MRPTERLTPRLDAQHMRTFQVVSPLSTHWRDASCEEVECEMYLRGWKMQIDLSTELGQKQAHYIKHQSGRAFRYEQFPGGMVELTFSSGQPCFSEHKVRLEDRPEKFLVKGGDFRGNPLRTPTRVHKRPEFWVEEFQENQDRIKSAIEKG